MHELSLTRNIVQIVSEHAQDKTVKYIRLTVGPNTCVDPRSIKFCFDLVAQGTKLANAKLIFLDGEKDEFKIKNFEYDN